MSIYHFAGVFCKNTFSHRTENPEWPVSIALCLLFTGIFAFILAIAQLFRSLAARQVSFAALLACFATIEIFLFLLRSGLLLFYPQFFGMQLVAGSLMGPLIFCYFESTRRLDFSLKYRDALHLIPAFVVLIALTPFWSMPASQEKILLVRIFTTGEPVWVRLVGMAICASILFYLTFAAVRLFLAFRSQALNVQRWAILIVLLSLWFLAICLAGFAVYLSHFNLLALTGITFTLSLIAIFVLGQRYPHVLQHTAPQSARYQKSTTGGLDLAKLLERLDILLRDDLIYRDPNLTLKSLSATLGITAHQLSEILNRHHAMNFNQFINAYRIKAAVRLLQEPTPSSITMIGYQVGFRSYSTFHHAFRKTHKKSPAEFLSGSVKVK